VLPQQQQPGSDSLRRQIRDRPALGVIPAVDQILMKWETCTGPGLITKGNSN
jgi:hypothetical protein